MQAEDKNLLLELYVKRMRVSQELQKVTRRLLDLNQETNMDQLLLHLAERQTVFELLTEIQARIEQLGKEFVSVDFPEANQVLRETSVIVRQVRELDELILVNLNRCRQAIVYDLNQINNKKRLTNSYKKMPRLEAKFVDKKG